MTRPNILLGAFALSILSALAGPASAQHVITNPGWCAQFYPNANCQNKGPNNPYIGDYQRRLDSRDAYVFGAGPCTAGAEFYVGRGGRRIYCY